ncbi:hypothetical protein RUM44_000408 [Polyplax serrata]|uniref:Uncharacterized protein n=1 Tax=Polyplax serrata TaxID=468196 RepID=A0ABR1B5H0_POLSC
MNSGIMTLRRDDMIVVLFVTIHHHGERARSVVATMVECCEKINDEETDCDIIQIHGEHLGVVQPGSTLNVTFLYPNVYGYNRRASCTVGIWNRGEESGSDDTNVIRHKIEFETMIRNSPEETPPHLQGLYNPDKIVKCETIDLDPFDGCNPVDCRLKYSGRRSYFNRKRNRCQRIPKCTGDPNKELPDVVYVPMSNTCRNLDKAVKRKDIVSLINEKYEIESNDLETSGVNIQCHHGEIDVRTRLCVCDKGWTSVPFDPEEYNQGNAIYHMCDKKCHPDDTSPVNKVPIFIGLALAVLILFLILTCELFDLYLMCFNYNDDNEPEEVTFYPVSQH